jgi:hypothetical protein
MELRNSIVADGRITEFQIPIARDIPSCLVIDLSEDNRFVFSTWDIPADQASSTIHGFRRTTTKWPQISSSISRGKLGKSVNLLKASASVPLRGA